MPNDIDSLPGYSMEDLKEKGMYKCSIRDNKNKAPFKK